MAKYATNINSNTNHTKAKKQLNVAFCDEFVSYDETPSEDFDFRFELEQELSDEGWSKMPNMLVIYNVEGCTFEGGFK